MDGDLIRDFVYLDWERIRSMAAQVFGGIPEVATQESSHEAGGEGRAGGSFLGVAKVSGALDYRYFRSEAETRSLHHHVYSLLERELVSTGRATVRGAADPWLEHDFRDGQLLIVTGVIRFIDYDWLVASMEALPKVAHALAMFQERAVTEQLRANEITPAAAKALRDENKRTSAELKGLKLDELGRVVRQFYGEDVLVKILCALDSPENVLVGTGASGGFTESIPALARKYGNHVDAGWKALIQVNLPGAPDTALRMPTGNELEDQLEEVVLSLNDMGRIASSVAFPAVSMTPLSIYREV